VIGSSPVIRVSGRWRSIVDGLVKSASPATQSRILGGAASQPVSGQQIGHYQVVAKIGEGGMGRGVPRRDTRLKRELALKVLPQTFATDPYRMARFQREAQLLASLKLCVNA